jgi:rubrerythrin
LNAGFNHKESDMPLTNFGSILNFAETLEKEDTALYTRLAAHDACADIKEMLELFIRDNKKNIQNVQRTRRENVTEMILEPVKDFTRAPYQDAVADADLENLDAARALSIVKRREQNAERYYSDAALKIKALSEVSRALKTIGKKHTAHLKKLDTV